MKPIEFSKIDNDADESIFGGQKTSSGRFADQILKPEFRDRKLRFELGTTWLRIVPALAGSAYSWMLGVQVQEYTGGRFVHPRTLKKGAMSVFDHAYTWMKANHPDALFSTENRTGVRLLTDLHTLCWVLVEEGGKTVARLLYASGYDGRRGGTSGLGHLIYLAARDMDETTNLVTRAADPEAGFRISIEKKQNPGAKFPAYSVRPGRVAAPMAPILEEMSQEEVEVLCPLENVVQQLTEEEQWQCLETTMAKDTVAEIRASRTAA